MNHEEIGTLIEYLGLIAVIVGGLLSFRHVGIALLIVAGAGAIYFGKRMRAGLPL